MMIVERQYDNNDPIETIVASECRWLDSMLTDEFRYNCDWEFC